MVDVSCSLSILLVIVVELQKQQNMQLYQWQVYFLSFTLDHSWINRQINRTKTISKVHLREFTFRLFHLYWVFWTDTIDLTSALNNPVKLHLVIRLEIFENMSEVSQNILDILAILFNSHSRNRLHLPGLQGRTCRTSCGLVACNCKTMFIEKVCSASMRRFLWMLLEKHHLCHRMCKVTKETSGANKIMRKAIDSTSITFRWTSSSSRQSIFSTTTIAKKTEENGSESRKSDYLVKIGRWRSELLLG